MKYVAACEKCHSQYDVSSLSLGDTFACRCGEKLTVQEPKIASAAVICCSNCGGPRGSAVNQCEYCGATYTAADRDLDGICAHCMTRVSSSSKFCPHCGAAVCLESLPSQTSSWNCPACGDGQRLESLELYQLRLLQCASCSGLWLGSQALRQLISQERNSADEIKSALQSRITPPPIASTNEARGRRYRPCAECNQLMVQQRFGESSVVVIDICRPHGIWLDHGELRQILEYVHSGGAVAQDLEVRQQLRAEAQRMRILNTNMNTDDEHQNAGSFLSLVEGFLGLFDK